MDKIQGKIKFIAPSLQDEHYSTAYILLAHGIAQQHLS